MGISLPQGRGVANEVLIICFPNGDAELYAGGNVPSVGDRITRHHSDWIVSRVDTDPERAVRVTVMPSAVVRDDAWPAPYGFVRP
jgi:hypothetical protein